MDTEIEENAIMGGPDHEVDMEVDDHEGPKQSLRREAVDEVLVSSLAAGLSQVDAGDRAGVTDRTVRRRLEEPEFVARVRDKRREMVGEATGRVTSLLTAAVDTFGELLESADPGIRLRAATAIVRTTSEYHVNEDFAARLTDLEVSATRKDLA